MKDILINKDNSFENYQLDLVKLNNLYCNKEMYLDKEASLSFENMCNAAYKLNKNIKGVSGYRDYEYQKKLFEYYSDTYGLDYALKCSAKPGHSEHQSGLAIDIMGSNMDYNKFEDSEEFDWVSSNCYKYGFILRYPKGKEEITGFKYEPWHYRYVGIDAATYIYQNNLTLEEYKKTDK